VAHQSEATALTQPRPLALLALLLLARPRGAQPREQIMQLLWPNTSDEQARRGLRNALYAVRQLLGNDAIISMGERLLGINPRVITCDALELERGEERGRRSAMGDVAPFHGFSLEDAAPFNSWVEAERVRLRAVARSGADLLGREEPPPRAAHPHAMDPYTCYLRGHYFFLRAAHGGAPDELEQSRRWFERALQLDPAYPAALAGLANYFAVAARRGPYADFAATFGRAIELSHRAASLDPALAIPHVHLGVQALYLYDEFERAGREFATAAFKEPEYAEGRRFYGVWLGIAGRHQEAVGEIEMAARLEPDIPHVLSSLGAARLAVGDVTGAEDALRATLRLDPRHRAARERLMTVLERTNRTGEALDERERDPAFADAALYREAWRSDGLVGYQRVQQERRRELIAALEVQLIEGVAPTVNDIFSPPVLRLVQLLREAGDERRARAWELQASAGRPALAHWFAGLRSSAT
jgi:DNA-binding SARP family transcriptional activator